MNSIRRPRERPRVDSVNFFTFFWLLRLEAAYLVYRAWWDHRSVRVFDRSDVPIDRARIFVNRSLKLLRLNPTLRRLP